MTAGKASDDEGKEAGPGTGGSPSAGEEPSGRRRHVWWTIAVLGAVAVAGAAVAAGFATGLIGGTEESPSGPDSDPEATLPDSTAPSPQRERFVRFCVAQDLSVPHVCECVAAEVEKRVPDPTGLTIPDYVRVTANHGLVLECDL